VRCVSEVRSREEFITPAGCAADVSRRLLAQSSPAAIPHLIMRLVTVVTVALKEGVPSA
jgi:hypothetical protein